MQAENNLLQKRVNLFDGISIVAGAMIGSGIFIVSADIARTWDPRLVDGSMANYRNNNCDRCNKLWRTCFNDATCGWSVCISERSISSTHRISYLDGQLFLLFSVDQLLQLLLLLQSSAVYFFPGSQKRIFFFIWVH